MVVRVFIKRCRAKNLEDKINECILNSTDDFFGCSNMQVIRLSINKWLIMIMLKAEY